MKIETVFRMAFTINDKGGDYLRFCNTVERITRAKKYEDVEYADTGAGPAWDGYMIFTCKNRGRLVDIAPRLYRAARGARVTLEDWNA